jgi:hypothetical protein
MMGDESHRVCLAFSPVLRSSRFETSQWLAGKRKNSDAANSTRIPALKMKSAINTAKVSANGENLRLSPECSPTIELGGAGKSMLASAPQMQNAPRQARSSRLAN